VVERALPAMEGLIARAQDDELRRAGVLVGASGLRVDATTTVRAPGGELTVTDGPYQPLHAARAELLRRAGDATAADAAYEAAIALSGNASERAALERRRSAWY
jgi:predicted RNA polymerase sigma factor